MHTDTTGKVKAIQPTINHVALDFLSNLATPTSKTQILPQPFIHRAVSFIIFEHDSAKQLQTCQIRKYHSRFRSTIVEKINDTE